VKAVIYRRIADPISLMCLSKSISNEVIHGY